MVEPARAQSGRSWAVVEALAVFLFILAYIWLLDRRLPYSWVVLIPALIGSHLLHHEKPADLGLRRSGFWPAVRAAAPFVGGAVLAIGVLGWYWGGVRSLSATHAARWAAYFVISGTLQQYLLNGYFMQRLGRPFLVVLLFAAAHAPNAFLMALAAAGGYVSLRFYRAHPNLYALGLAHAAIAFALYLFAPDQIVRGLQIGPGYLAR